MTQKNRKPGDGRKKEDERRGGFKKSHEYEEHEYSKRVKNEYLHVRDSNDLEDDEEDFDDPITDEEEEE